ncbi:MAG: DUF5123 domain-containing protein [Planctomycetes bacterium]|nr:DUF5123 domain-containing protein [Planctomycetota bacterium]
MKFSSYLLAIFVLMNLAACSPNIYHISTDGQDGSRGNASAPWQTFAYALEHAEPGSIIKVHGGVYKQKIELWKEVGDGKVDLIFQAIDGERPVIDGSDFVLEETSALVTLSNVESFVLEGFEIRNFSSNVQNATAMGIFINGKSSGIKLKNIVIHDIDTEVNKKNGGDAHGLAVYGDDKKKPISDLEIDGVHIYNCRLGSSEAMVVNGNVDGFVIQNCRVHDCNNIGIDMIGHEKVCSNAELDQARNGICRLNRVYNITSKGNPAYGNESSAGGIYVDGARDIIIEKNQIWNCDIGIEIASEHKGKSTSNIKVRHNLVEGSYQSGLLVGGYAAKRGSADNILFEANSLYNNDKANWSLGEIAFQFHVNDCRVINNTLFAGKRGDRSVFVGRSSKKAKVENVIFEGNQYWSEAKKAFWLLSEPVKSFAEWQKKGYDSNGRWQKPEEIKINK